MAEQERISQATREVAERDAKAAHGAPQVPTPEEEAAAPEAADPKAAQAYREYLDRAADAKGEGRIP
jgi:hypothetical protein